MPLIYSAVARGPAILAEYAVFAGNFSSVAKDYLSKSSSNTGRFSYTVDSHVFSFLSDTGYSACSGQRLGCWTPHVVACDGMGGELHASMLNCAACLA